MDIVDRDGRVRPAALIRTLLSNPSLVFSFLSMKKDYDAALASLKAAWVAGIENIKAP
jgi:hypothetical protein